MKIRALTLENVRKFGGRRATIDGISDGISVICEANEFGKSTFFDAVHAVIFEKYTASGKSIQSLRPHAGGSIRIELVVEVDGTQFQIEKRFLTQKSARVTDLNHGTVIARDGEAEDWIARHVGDLEQGPAGLLWVRQGVLGLQPADAKKAEIDRLTGARRDLLSSVAGEIEQVTGGRTMDRILNRCQQDLDALATTGRHAPKGEWKAAVEGAKVLTVELETLTAQCSDLSSALEERRTIEADLLIANDPAEKIARETDLNNARQAEQEAANHAQKIAAAQGEVNLATMRQTEAVRQRDTLSVAITAAETAGRAVTTAEGAHTTASTALAAKREAEGGTRLALSAAEKTTKTLRTEQTQAERIGRTQRAHEEVTRLEALRKQVQEQINIAARSVAIIENLSVTRANLAQLEAAVAEVTRLNGLAAASTVRITADYQGDARLFVDGETLNHGQPIVLRDGTQIGVPGVGTLHVHLPEAASDGDIENLLAAALAVQSDALSRCDASTLNEARERLQTRSEAENGLKLAEQMQRSLAPDGIDALEQALATARETAKGSSDIAPRLLSQIASDLDVAEAGEVDARARLSVAVEQVAEARVAMAAADAALASARDHQDKTDAQAGEGASRATRLADLAANVLSAEAEVTAKQATLHELMHGAPDTITAKANLKRAEAAFDNARQRRERLLERRAELSARIDTRAEEGIEERRDEVSGRLETLNARATRYQNEVDALVRLREALDTARADAREAYFEPVQKELGPLLRILHDDAGIDWDTDSITPGALRRGGEVEAFETLSGGTQEQIAILTRLAFARLFARRGQHLPIILDDALVYSDDDRIVKMFTALNRVALDQQIIVFSCRQLAFAGLGGNRPEISVVDAA